MTLSKLWHFCLFHGKTEVPILCWYSHSSSVFSNAEYFFQSRYKSRVYWAVKEVKSITIYWGIVPSFTFFKRYVSVIENWVLKWKLYKIAHGLYGVFWKMESRWEWMTQNMTALGRLRQKASLSYIVRTCLSHPLKQKRLKMESRRKVTRKSVKITTQNGHCQCFGVWCCY